MKNYHSPYEVQLLASTPKDIGRTYGLSRRSFLECATLGGLGFVLPGLNFAASADPEPYPEALGRGFLSTGRTVRVPIADLATSKAEWRAEGSHAWDIEFTNSRSSYARVVTGNARAKFGIGAVRGDIKVHSSRDFRSERKTIHLVAWKRVQSGHYTLDDPVLKNDVAQESSPWTFVTRFGDELVDRVTMGGELILVYSLEFDHEKEARDLTVGGTAKYKTSSASAAFHEAIRTESEGARVSMRGFCKGVRTVPTLLADRSRVGLNDGTGVAELLAFWDNFDDLVASDGVPAPIGLRSIPVRDVRGMNLKLDISALRQFDRVFRDCETIDDQIDERLANLRYLQTDALAWNTHVDLQEVQRKIELLETYGSSLRDWVEPRIVLEDVASFSDQLTPPVTMEDLPTIPENWLCRDLQQAPGWNLTYRGANTSVKKSQRLPQRLIPGQHIRISGAVTKYGNDPFDNGTLKFDNGDKIITYPRFNNHTYQVNEIVQVPDGANSVVLTGTTYGGDPLVVSLVLWA